MRKIVILLVILVQLLTVAPAMAHGKRWTPYDIGTVTLGFSAVTTEAKYTTRAHMATVSLFIHGDSNAPYLQTRLPFVPKQDGVFEMQNAINGGAVAVGECWYYAGSTIVYCAPRAVTPRDNWERYGMKGFTATFIYGY